MDIKGVNVPTRLVLAPMAGVTDAAFRTVCREQGAGLTFTEMISSRALVHDDGKTKSLMRPAKDEHPLGVQLFGNDPAVMGEAAQLALELTGAEIIDINMGCPVGKVVKNGDGSALMRDLPLASKIIESVSRAVPVPVTVKFRKGWDNGHVCAVEFAQMAEASGAAAVTVHGRTRSQLYSGVADWNVIRDVKAAVNIPVIANGDVFTENDAVRILDVTKADLVMIGRGSFGDPWLFARADAAISGRDVPPAPPWRERIKTAMRQLEMNAEDKGERVACLEARRHYAWYLKGMPYGGFYKEKLVHMTTLDEYRRMTETILADLKR